MPRSSIQDLDRLTREKHLPRPDFFVSSAEAALPEDPGTVHLVEVKIVTDDEDPEERPVAVTNGNGNGSRRRRRRSLFRRRR
jgi:hypothetical protein